MAPRKKYRDVVVVADSSDDDAGAGDRQVVEVSEDEADDLSSSSGDEDESEASSFHPSDDESEASESDDDNRDYQQSEDDYRDEDAGGSSPSSDDDKPGDNEDDDALSKRVVQLLQEKRDIGNLRLKMYKAYLRKHGLRIAGSKVECLIRIHEHWRIKDGNGEVLYPRPSFFINCTGDVCKGDVVLFTQRVYQKFEKLTRSGKVLGSRTVAGRVVKESYGAAKQQHTFTVEVLWSKGTKKLPPLFPLLIKGRNLYRLKTFRQPWKNEADRCKSLDEKHNRGTIARQKRDARIQERTRHKSRQTSDRGERHQKHHSTSNNARDSLRIQSERGKHGDQREKDLSSANQVASICHKKGQCASKATMNETTRVRTFKPPIRHQKPTYARNKASTSESHPVPYQRFHGLQLQSDHRNAQYALPKGHVPNSAFMRPSGVGYYGSQSFHQAPGSYSYRSEHLPSAIPLPAFHSDRYMPQNQGFCSCSTQGCKNLGSQGCVISGCWYCCRRAGMRCHVHK